MLIITCDQCGSNSQSSPGTAGQPANYRLTEYGSTYDFCSLKCRAHWLIDRGEFREYGVLPSWEVTEMTVGEWLSQFRDRIDEVLRPTNEEWLAGPIFSKEALVKASETSDRILTNVLPEFIDEFKSFRDIEMGGVSYI